MQDFRPCSSGSLLGIASISTGSSTYYFTRDPQGTLIARRQGAGSGSTNNNYLLDHQGSVVALTADDGNTTSYAYDNWGAVTSSTGTLANTNPFWWQGYYDQQASSTSSAPATTTPPPAPSPNPTPAAKRPTPTPTAAETR
jgi:YD repeat-containing protein